jgi:hypothetical protein
MFLIITHTNVCLLCNLMIKLDKVKQKPYIILDSKEYFYNYLNYLSIISKMS